MESDKKRIEYIDIAKGIGIILMVLGHIPAFSNNYKFAYKFIYAFHMPLFFIISGYLFAYKYKQNQIVTGEYLVKKIRTLLVPYFLFGIPLFLPICLYRDSLNFTTCLKQLLFYPDEIDNLAAPLWFLQALFFTEIIYFFINRYFSKVFKVIIILFLAFFANYNRGDLVVRLPFCLNASFVGLIFFQIGVGIQYCLQRKNIISKLFSLSLTKNIFLFLLLNILVLINSITYMRLYQYGFIPLFYLNAMLGYILTINVSKYIYKFTTNKNYIINNILINIGKNSILFVCLNGVFILGTKYCNTSVLITFIYSLVMIYLISYLINRTNLKVVLGR